MIDKIQVMNLLREKLAADLQALTASQQAAQAGATHEESRQEDPKDTRAIEATYLARGLAERVEAMRETLALISRLTIAQFGDDDPVAVTALLAIEEPDGVQSIYLIVPRVGGERLSVAGATVRTLTPLSPLGRALLGKQVGDAVSLDLPGRRLQAEIRWLR